MTAATEKTQEQLAAEELKVKQAAEKKAAADAEKKAAKEKAAAEKAAAKEQDKKDKAAAAEKAKAEKLAAKVEQNGVTRPQSGATQRVWQIADTISAKNKAPATRKEVMDAGTTEGLNAGTINTQFGKWQKFHGVVAVKEPKAAPAAAPAATQEAAATTSEAGEQAQG